MSSSVKSMISLIFFTNSFENIHRILVKNGTKANKKTVKKSHV